MLKACLLKDKIEAGCDEAGRGCLAGPVFASAVILPSSFSHPLLNDSKMLTDGQRKMLRPLIEQEAIAWAVASVNNEEIDKINILNASIQAMHLALDKLKIFPEHLIIDGNRFKKYKKVPHQCIIKGDSIYRSIAAASILAKTYRDDYMDQLHIQYPHYKWTQNKGYATEWHRQAIVRYGTTPYHRMSFRLADEQLELLFQEGEMGGL